MSYENPEIEETVEALCELAGVEVADIGKALHIQPGTLRRTLRGNPTVQKLKAVAWALGTKWYWLAYEPAIIRKLGKSMIQFEAWAPAYECYRRRMEEADDLRLAWMRKSGGEDVTDKEQLAVMYPPEAIKGEVQDTRFMDTSTSTIVPMEERIENMPEKTRRYKIRKMSEGLPHGYRISDTALEKGWAYVDYSRQGWTVQALIMEGLVVEETDV